MSHTLHYIDDTQGIIIIQIITQVTSEVNRIIILIISIVYLYGVNFHKLSFQDAYGHFMEIRKSCSYCLGILKRFFTIS